MTNGTSQGLFVVVAIVIFGIFIGLTYTLFGSEGLSNDLENMFSDASEQATKDLNKQTNILIWDNVKPFGSGYPLENFNKTENDITFKSNGTPFLGAYIDSTNLEANMKYKLTFNVENLEGTLDNVGGHMHFSENTKVLVNGKKVGESSFTKESSIASILGTNAWNIGVPLDGSGEYLVELYFDTNLWDVNYNYTTNLNSSGYRNIYIEGNRQDYGKPYTFKLSDIMLDNIN